MNIEATDTNGEIVQSATINDNKSTFKSKDMIWITISAIVGVVIAWRLGLIAGAVPAISNWWPILVAAITPPAVVLAAMDIKKRELSHAIMAVGYLALLVCSYFIGVQSLLGIGLALLFFVVGRIVWQFTTAIGAGDIKLAPLFVATLGMLSPLAVAIWLICVLWIGLGYRIVRPKTAKEKGVPLAVSMVASYILIVVLYSWYELMPLQIVNLF